MYKRFDDTLPPAKQRVLVLEKHYEPGRFRYPQKTSSQSHHEGFRPLKLRLSLTLCFFQQPRRDFATSELHTR
jgi:hypothetical protein